MSDGSNSKQMKTFLEYREYDLYDSYITVIEVPTRDLQKLDFSKVPWTEPPSYLGFPTEFRFFDAEVSTANGRTSIGAPQNYSNDYRVTGMVMSVDEYEAREKPKLEEYRRDMRGRMGAFMDNLFDGGLSLKKAFSAAVSEKRPVMDRYIREVEDTISSARRQGVTHLALWSEHSRPDLVTKNMVVLDKQLRQIFPLPGAPAQAPKGPAA